MRFFVSFFLLFVVLAAGLNAGDRTHRVWLWQESRDCLWNLAKKYYGDPHQWKRIYEANKDRIENPSKIYPKQELIIPPLEGQ